MAFVGEHGGAVCTSSNARAILEWAFERGDKVLFFPDQHLGRNTGFEMGYDESDMRVWNPHRDLGGLDERQIKECRFLLWKGHCHRAPTLRTGTRRSVPRRAPRRRGDRSPECRHEVAVLARSRRVDVNGSWNGSAQRRQARVIAVGTRDPHGGSASVSRNQTRPLCHSTR